MEIAELVSRLMPNAGDMERADETMELVSLLEGALVAALIIADRPAGECVDANYHKGATKLLTSLLNIIDESDLQIYAPSIDRDRIVLALSRQAGRAPSEVR